MKQLAFMVVATLLGTAGVYLASPFYGVFVYYLFAVLRPQYMWQWSLPGGVSWSFYVAVATIGAAVLGMRDVRASKMPLASHSSAGPRLSNAHVTVLAFGSWVLVTCLTARNFDVAWEWTVEYVKIMVMFVVATKFVKTARQVWALLVMAGLVLAYIAYEVNYLYFVNHYLGIFHNGYGGLDNNGAGLMLAMGVPICWFVYEGTQRWWRWFFPALIPVIVHAVLMTYSRGAMVSLIATCPWLLWRSRQKGRLIIALSAFVILAIPVMAGPEIKARFLTIEENEVDASANARRKTWAAAWQMAKDNPIFGVGVRNANLYSYQYGAEFEGQTIHSQYLQVAADNGLVGLALYLVVLWTAWRALRRCHREQAGRDDPESQMVMATASGIEGSLVTYMVGSVFLSLEVFELPYLLLFLAAQLPIVLAGTSPRHPRQLASGFTALPGLRVRAGSTSEVGPWS
jgi:probable O-glycosylation ligase (exosortase A-associated)